MRTKKQIDIEKIVDRLSLIRTEIEFLNTIHMYDINIFMEDFICGLLNILNGYKLANLNGIKENYPGIDLGDTDNRIAIQVTSEKDRKKIQKTIDIFVSNKYYENYDRLIVFILGQKTNYRLDFDTKNTISFSKKDDVWDFNYLIKRIDAANEDTISSIACYLENQLPEFNQIIESNKIHTVSNILKKNEILDKYTIHRKLIEEKDYEIAGLGFDKGIDLKDILKEKKYFTVISDAAFGKTTAMKLFCNDINDNTEMYAFYHSIRTYEGIPLNELIPVGYRSVPSKNIVMLLDGFDEIRKEQINVFISQLENFINNNPDTKIIITSRSNFYRRSNEKTGGTFVGFDTYLLAPLVNEDYVTYLSNTKTNKKDFWSEVNKKGYRDIIKSPFYLVRTVDLFNKDGVLPTRGRFMKVFIDRSFKWDLKKQRNKDYGENKENAYKLLQILALTLECLERNYLQDDEYNLLMTEKNQRELVEMSSLWKQKQDNVWSFEHNNFGEYLAADYLKNVPLEVVKDLVTESKSQNRIKKSWTNTISFLVTISDNEDLENWLMEVEPLICIKFEKTLLEKDKLYKIFKGIFEEYEKKRIWMEDTRNIGRYFSTEKTVDFLLDKIEENKHFTITANAISIFIGLEDVFDKHDRARSVLEKVCISRSYRSREKYYALTALGTHKLGNSDSLKKIIINNKKGEDSYLRAGYYRYCYLLNIVDDNFDIIIEKARVTNKVSFASSSTDDDINLFDEIYNLEQCFGNIKTITGLEKAIQLITSDNCINISREKIDPIFESAKFIFDCGGDVFNIISTLIKYYDSNYEYESVKRIMKYVKIYGWKTQIFELLKEEDYTIICKDKEKKEIVGKTNKLEVKTINEKNYAKIVFHKDDYYKIIQEIFSIIGKEEITKEDIEKIPYSKLKGRYDLQRTKNLLYQHALKHKSIKIAFLNDIDWKRFVIKESYHLVCDKKVELEDAEIILLKNICFENLPKVDFRYAIQYKSKTKFSLNELALYLWYFGTKYEWRYPDNILLDMLQFDMDYSEGAKGIGYIEKYVDATLIKARIIDNITNFDIRDCVFENHIVYSLRNNILLDENVIGTVLKDEERSISDKCYATKYLLSIKTANELLSEYEAYMQGDDYWRIIEEILGCVGEQLCPYLERKLKEEKDERSQLLYAKMLIKNKSLIGLKYYFDWMCKNRKAYNDDSIDSINASVIFVDSIEAVDLLINILELTYEIGFKDIEFDGVGTNARKTLINIARQSNNNCKLIYTKVEKLIASRKDLPNIGFCHYILIELDDIYMRETDKYDIYDAINMVKFVNNHRIVPQKNNWL